MFRKFLILTAMVPLAASCTSSSVSSSGAHEDYNSVTGNRTSMLEASLERSHGAAQQALRELEFTIEEDRKDALQALLTARMADKSVVRVTLVRKSDTLTEATVGIGTFGKESTTATVMEKIRAHLK